MLALGDVLAEEMTKMGLELNPQLFVSQVKRWHGFEVKKPCHFSLYENRMMLYMIPELYKPKPQFEFGIKLSDTRIRSIENVIYDPRVGLLYPALFLPEIIDYADRYPDIKKAEDLMVIPKQKNGERIKKWKDEAAVLKMSRNEVLKMIYHVNNYILYDNRESLAWFVTYAMPVLQAMFVDFHMEHEPIIDSLILVRTRSGDARLEALFAERNADGSIYIRDGLLDYILKNEKKNSPRFKNTIRQYVAGCVGHDIYYDRMERFPQVLMDNFTQDERRMIVARIMSVVFHVYPGSEIDKMMKIIVEHDPGFIDFAVSKNYYESEDLRTGLSIYRMHYRAERWKIIVPTGKD